MYLSRLAFHTVPGKTHEVEQQLQHLREMVLKAGGSRPRVARAHFASLGAPDVVFARWLYNTERTRPPSTRMVVPVM